MHNKYQVSEFAFQIWVLFLLLRCKLICTGELKDYCWLEMWVIIWYNSLLEILLILGNTALQSKCIEICKIIEKVLELKSYLKFPWNWASYPTSREVLFIGSFLNIIDPVMELPSRVLVSYPFLTLFMLVLIKKNNQLKEFLMKRI